jgi:hypothetical protein
MVSGAKQLILSPQLKDHMVSGAKQLILSPQLKDHVVSGAKTINTITTTEGSYG